MLKRPAAHSALGIATGDIVTTSYETGPYEVWNIRPPRRTTFNILECIVREYCEVSLTLITPGQEPRGDSDFSWINHIRLDGGRYLAGPHDEVFVTAGSAAQRPLFITELPEEAPYALQAGVNYSAGWRRVWHCDKCGLDWNDSAYAERRPCELLDCHRCGHFGGGAILYLSKPPLLGEHSLDGDLDWYLDQLVTAGEIPILSHLRNYSEVLVWLKSLCPEDWVPEDD